MSKVEVWTLLQWILMQYNNHSSISYFVRYIPPPDYILTLVKPFSFVWYVIPPLKTGFLASTRDLFLWFWQWKHQKKRRSQVRFMLSGIILAQWRRPVASSEALNLLHWAMHVVTYRRIAMAIKTASFVGVFVDCCLFACCPGGCWGNTEQVVAQHWHPVASGVALDMLHWVMSFVLHRRTAVAIKTAGRWGAFVHHRCLVCIIIHSYKTMLWSIKTKDELT